MFMIEMPLKAADLMRFAHSQGHPLSSDGDFGYAAHAWLAASLGRLAPVPFRLVENRRGLRLLGYCDEEITVLRDHASAFTEPSALAVCDWPNAASKAMPETWTAGRRLGFEVRACPVSRSDRERDVYLVALERAKEKGVESPNRAEIYVDWLIQRMDAAREIGGRFMHPRDGERPPVVDLPPKAVTLTGFRRVRTLRKPGRRKSPKGVERPDALFIGELIIRDADRFGNLLRRGIGRHRSFGFGMLLLRPPARAEGP